MNVTSIRLMTRPLLVATTILAAHSAFAAKVVFHVRNQTTVTLTLAGSQLGGVSVWDLRPQGSVPPNATADWAANNPQVFGGPTSGSVTYKVADNLPMAVFTWDTAAEVFHANMPSGYVGQVNGSPSVGFPTVWTVNVTVTATPVAPQTKLASVALPSGPAATTGPVNGVTLLLDGSAMANVSAVDGIELIAPDLAANPAAAEKVRTVVVSMPFTPLDLAGALGQIKAGTKKTMQITLFDGAGHATSRFKLNGCVPVGLRLPNLNIHDHRGAQLGLIFSYQSVEVS